MSILVSLPSTHLNDDNKCSCEKTSLQNSFIPTSINMHFTSLCLYYQLFILTWIVCLDHDYLILANFNARKQTNMMTGLLNFRL